MYDESMHGFDENFTIKSKMGKGRNAEYKQQIYLDLQSSSKTIY